MKVGDLVYGRWNEEEFSGNGSAGNLGIIIEVINSDYTVPPVCKVLWQDGLVEKEWTDDLDIFNEN